MIPPEFWTDSCLYINPSLGLKIGFEGAWICERIPIAKGNKTIERSKWLGVILIESQLRRRIEEAVGQRPSNTDVEALVRDCYELIVEFVRGMDRRQDYIGVRPHIYAATPREFAMFASSVQVTRDAVAASQAVQVL